MGLLSDSFRKRQEEEEQISRPPTPNDMYDLGYEEDEPSLMELFSRWAGHKIKQGKVKLAEVR